jgi:hypothetical protein
MRALALCGGVLTKDFNDGSVDLLGCQQHAVAAFTCMRVHEQHETMHAWRIPLLCLFQTLLNS